MTNFKGIKNIGNLKVSIYEAVEFYKNFQLLSASLDQVFWMTEIGDYEKVVYVSPAFKKLWGYEPKELYRHPRLWTDLIYKEDKEKVSKQFDNFIKGKGKFDVEYRIINKKGEKIWIRDVGKFIKDSNKKNKFIIGVATNINKEFLYRQKLLKYKKKYGEIK